MNEEVQSNTPDSEPKRPLMPTKLRIVLWLGVLLAVIFLCFPGEPMHEGLTLSEWLEHPGGTSMRDEAIIQFGTNGIPFYLKMLEAEDSGFKTKLIKNLNKLPLVEIDPFTAMEKQEAAIWALHTLGTNAQSAYPMLLNKLKEKDWTPGLIFALCQIRPNDQTIFLVAFKHSLREVRRDAAVVARWKAFAKGSPLPIDLLLPGLEDIDGQVRSISIRALGRPAATNQTVIDALESCLTDSDLDVRQAATNSLRRIRNTANGVATPSTPE